MDNRRIHSNYIKIIREFDQEFGIVMEILEAYSKGIDFDTCIKKNPSAKKYWTKVQLAIVQREKDAENRRLKSLAMTKQKKQKELAMAKLSQEELQAFGLAKKGKPQ